MKEPRMTQREILQDVVKLVKKQGGRGLTANGLCVYQGEEGRICGHSMALKPSLRLSTFGRANTVIAEGGDTIHQKKYQGHPASFWRRVQGFHDANYYWDGVELNTEGEKRLEMLANKNFD